MPVRHSLFSALLPVLLRWTLCLTRSDDGLRNWGQPSALWTVPGVHRQAANGPSRRRYRNSMAALRPSKLRPSKLRPYARARLRGMRELARTDVIVAHNCSQLHGMRVCCPPLAKALEYLQLQQPCEQSRYRIVDKKKYWNGGIGAVLVSRFPPERRSALSAGKGLAFVVPRQPWIYDKTCPEKWWECAFLPASSCRAPSSDKLSRRHGALSHKISQSFPHHMLQQAQRMARDEALFLAHTLALTLAPLPALQRSIDLVKRSIGWHRPIIGVHMRHGDIWKEHTVPSTQAFADAVAQVYAETRITRVFLATNDKHISSHEFLRYVRVRAKRRGITLPANFSVVHQDAVHRDTGEEASRSSQTHEQAQAAFTDLLLLAESDALICLYGSGFGKVAALLGAVRHGLHRFAFLDCDEWGGNIPRAPSLNWIPGFQLLVPWHSEYCQRKWLKKPPGRSRWAPDNPFATHKQNARCASDANCCENDCKREKVIVETDP